MGHDILIYVESKVEAQFYDTLLKYIGANSHKRYPKESDKKNGIRVVMSRTKHRCTRGTNKIKKKF